MIEMAFIVGSLSSLQPTDGRPLPSAGNDWPIRQTSCIVEMHDLWSCMRQRRRRGAEFFVTHLRPSFSIVCRTPAPVVGGYVYTLGKASWLCDLLSQPMAAGCYSPACSDYHHILEFFSKVSEVPTASCSSVPLFLDIHRFISSSAS
jgi:hypothetical protein